MNRVAIAWLAPCERGSCPYARRSVRGLAIAIAAASLIASALGSWALGASKCLPSCDDAPGISARLDLELLRWDVAEKEFSSVTIDVEPREFEARADTECTLVTVSSLFSDTRR